MTHNYTHIKKEMGENIRTIREKQGRPQAEVAAEAGMSARHFIRIEEGTANPTFEKIYRIVKALKVKLSQIVSF